ncbi:MAG: hypothetical protein ABSH20_29455, partial [Tepidisphaeraceae bacterium]
ARPRIEDVRRVHAKITGGTGNLPVPDGGSPSVWAKHEIELPAAKTRPADDFAWQDFLKSARAAVESANPQSEVQCS